MSGVDKQTPFSFMVPRSIVRSSMGTVVPAFHTSSPYPPL
jgi:hypothetical protein